MSVFQRLACCFLLFVQCGGVVVDTLYGEVRGHTVPVFNGRDNSDVVSFLGVPFAQDTSGQNRFRKPIPPAPWRPAVFEASTLREACPQRRVGVLAPTHPWWSSFGEDCLHLNIYTPSGFTNTSNYPVMVWMYGGGFFAGANIQYPGHFLATHDVVVVVGNYRLNRFGFAYTGNDACPGNFGLWDQKMSLDFVKDNIANFGGNPNKVTVFGQSAGGISTSFLVISPQTKDLFHHAIMMSGSETNQWNLSPPETHPENYIREVAEDLDCLGSDDYETIACLRTLPWETIQNRGSYDCPEGYLCPGMLPVVDDHTPEAFMPKLPRELRDINDVMQGPILAGINKDDGAFVVRALGGMDCCTKERLHELFSAMVTFYGSRVDASLINNTIQALEYNFSPWPYVDDIHENRRMITEMATDVQFGIGWDEQIKAHSQVATTYAYIFNYRSRKSGSPEFVGVSHSLEIPYVWGQTLINLPGNEYVKCDQEYASDSSVWTEEDIEYTVFIQDLWTNFAKYGNPTPDPVPNPSNIGGSTVWPEFTLNEQKILELHNVSMKIHDKWRQKDYAFWGNYLPYVGNFPPYFLEASDFPAPEELVYFSAEDRARMKHKHLKKPSV